MKIAIYSPYLDTAGGGEKYMLTIAEILSQDNEVDLLLDHHLQSLDVKNIISKMEQMHGLNLLNTNLVPSPMSPKSSAFEKYLFLKKYDVLICNTDGSIFYSSAKRSFIHFQVPFENTNALGVKGKIKLSSWNQAIYNSQFTKKIIEKSWPITGVVIYPPVSTDLFKQLKKKKQILTVGRFFSFDKLKKHQLMIDTFKEMVVNSNLKGWSLHLAGGMDEGNKEYLEQLKKSAKDFEIYFHPNISLKDLQKIYGESSIYWHAKGFGETDPKTFEHFGITTVEAMAAGCVPVVVNLGGQTEIVEDKISGFLWDTIEEWKEKTIKLAENPKLRLRVSQQAIKRSNIFDKKHFQEKIKKLVYS